MAYLIVRREERDYREAVPEHLRGKLSGVARCEEEALELTKRRGADKPDLPLTFDDKGQADRETALRAGIGEETWEKREWRKRQARER